jgi:hypothetical protein
MTSFFFATSADWTSESSSFHLTPPPLLQLPESVASLADQVAEKVFEKYRHMLEESRQNKNNEPSSPHFFPVPASPILVPSDDDDLSFSALTPRLGPASPPYQPWSPVLVPSDDDDFAPQEDAVPSPRGYSPASPPYQPWSPVYAPQDAPHDVAYLCRVYRSVGTQVRLEDFETDADARPSKIAKYRK